MRSTGYSGLIDCSWHEIENYLQTTESDFQRMGKLGGGRSILSSYRIDLLFFLSIQVHMVMYFVFVIE